MIRYVIGGRGAVPSAGKKKAQHPERRKWKRVQAGFNVTLFARGLKKLVQAEDVSSGGIRLRGEIGLPKNESVQLVFAVPVAPGSAEVRTVGCVVRVEEHPGGCAIEFEIIPPDSKKALTEYLEHEAQSAES